MRRKWLSTDSYTYLSFIQQMAAQSFRITVSSLSPVDIIKNREEGSTTNYDDKALSPSLFQWDTQNRVRPESNEGQAYIKQKRTMLLFVREQKNFADDKSRTMGYVYLGRVTLNEWEDKDLITRRQMQIRWNMVEPIPASVMHYARMKEVI